MYVHVAHWYCVTTALMATDDTTQLIYPYVLISSFTR